MAAPASVRILVIAELHGTIRIAEHPGPSGDEDTGSRLWVVVRDVREMAVLLLDLVPEKRTPRGMLI